MNSNFKGPLEEAGAPPDMRVWLREGGIVLGKVGEVMPELSFKARRVQGEMQDSNALQPSPWAVIGHPKADRWMDCA